MKKFLTILLVGILAVCCVAMSACKKPDPEGTATYKMYELTLNGTDVYALGDTVPESMFNPTSYVLTQEYIIMEFRADGTAVSIQNGQQSDVSVTWTKSGNTYTMTQVIQGETTILTATVDGEYLLIDVVPNMMSYKLKKA